MVGTGETNDCQDTFNDLALDSSIQGDPRAQDEDINTQPAVAEGILDQENKVAENDRLVVENNNSMIRV